MRKTAQGKAIYEAVEAFIKAIDDHQCKEDCYPVFTDTHIGLTGSEVSSPDGAKVEVTVQAEWRIKIACKKPIKKDKS